VNVGDYVQMNVGKPLRGFVVEPPPRSTVWKFNEHSIWILITHTPDGKFVGRTSPFQPEQVEVLSESR
jgi:hypothetical protein